MIESSEPDIEPLGQASAGPSSGEPSMYLSYEEADKSEERALEMVVEEEVVPVTSNFDNAGGYAAGKIKDRYTGEYGDEDVGEDTPEDTDKGTDERREVSMGMDDITEEIDDWAQEESEDEWVVE